MNDDARASATIRKWQKMRDKDEQDYEKGKGQLEKFMEAAVKKDIIRLRIEAELKEIRGSNRSRHSEGASGYNLVDDDYDPIVDGDTEF